MSAEPMFKVGDTFKISIAEVYRTTNEAQGGRKADEYVYRLKGNIPLIRERQLKLLERIEDESQT